MIYYILLLQFLIIFFIVFFLSFSYKQRCQQTLHLLPLEIKYVSLINAEW